MHTMWNRKDFKDLVSPPAIGMVHLLPLPGSPGWLGDLGAVEAAALSDAAALREGGISALMVENYHDVPFHKQQVPPETVAAMTRIIAAIRAAEPRLKLGVNVLRNDPSAALGIAVATGASFVRVNVHVGASVTDQGTIEGQAWRTLRLRRELGAEYVGILADVRVKHARPLVERPIGEEAQDLRLRGLADAVIVTGAATGSAADPRELALVREALPECPVLVGSGVTTQNVGQIMGVADGCIVGTSLKVPDRASRRSVVSTEKTRNFLQELAAAGAKGN